jgi:hypothetical protein
VFVTVVVAVTVVVFMTVVALFHDRRLHYTFRVRIVVLAKNRPIG